jgi:hypothetical protein
MSTRFSLPIRALVAATAVAASLLAPATAHAGSLTIGDGTGDSWQEEITNGKVTGFVPAGSAVNADIVAVKVKHAHRRVVVKTTFLDLSSKAEGVVTQTKIKTNEGKHYRLVLAKDGDRRGSTGYLAGRRCGGIHEKVSFAKNIVKISVPRRCLSAPRWIKVVSGGGNHWERGDGGRASYRDIAGSTGPSLSGKSGKIRRG